MIERREALRERIGGALEALYASSIDDHLGELAHHYGRSANLDAAVQYLTHAGRQKLEEARRVERRLADIPSADAQGNTRLPAEDEVAEAAALRAVRETQTARAGKREAVLDSVNTIWRYPIKSMAREELPAVEVTPRGVLGDRIYALVDKASNRAATVRRSCVS